MKKKFRQKLALFLALVIIFSMPVYAYDLDEKGNSIESVEYQDSDAEDFVPSSAVFAELGSVYKITIPKVIVLSGITKKAKYYVKVTGDIAGEEVVNVIPDDYVILSQNKKDDICGLISQEREMFDITMFNQCYYGKIVADNLSAGKWNGTFNFNLYLSKGEMVLGDIIIPDVDEWEASPNTLKSLRMGQSEMIMARLGEEEVSNDLVLTSSNEDIISVEGNVVKALKPGQADITVSYDDNGQTKSYAFTIVVNTGAVKELHSHDNVKVVRENVIDATCTNTGSYDEVVYCVDCNKELTRQFVTSPALGHNFVDGICTRCNLNEAYNLTADKMLAGKSATIGGTTINGTATSDATAIADNILSGKTAYINGNKVVGTFEAQEKTVTSSRNEQIITADDGKFLSKVTINALAPSGTYNVTKRNASIDMGATSNYRYVDTSNVPNVNSGTYTFPANDTGAKKDLGADNTYRYVNATNVYNKGKTDGNTAGANTVYGYVKAKTGYTGTVNSQATLNAAIDKFGGSTGKFFANLPCTMSEKDSINFYHVLTIDISSISFPSNYKEITFTPVDGYWLSYKKPTVVSLTPTTLVLRVGENSYGVASMSRCNLYVN